MPREAILPPEFGWLAGKISYLQRHSDIELSASCPVCGGSVHQGGEWPDRFRIFLDNPPRVWCRHCFYQRFADQEGASRIVDPVLLERRHKEQVEHEEARKRSAERALEYLRSSQRWQSYNENMDDAARAIWRRRGIPDSLQDYWQLGYDKAHVFWRNGAEFTDATLTIPIFDESWQALNIKHRLMHPPDNYGKYRYELRGAAGGYLYRTTPEEPLDGHVIAVEGEVKAMNVAVRGGSSQGTIVGIPGTNPGPEVIAQLKGADRVTLVVDPGAKAAGIKIAKAIGIAKCRLLETVMKIDDGILATDMSERKLAQLLRGATVLSAFVLGKS